jgi:N-methylhydantoinase A
VRTVLEPLERTDAAWAEARYAEMQREIETILPGLGAPVMHLAADLRYLGQEHAVTVSLGKLADWPSLRTEFDAAHQRAYGYAAADVEVQLINLRLTVVYPIERPRLASAERRTAGAAPFAARKIYSSRMQDVLEFRVFQRADLRAGDSVIGPAVVEEPGTTTVVDVGDTLVVEEHGCLIIEVTS